MARRSAAQRTRRPPSGSSSSRARPRRKGTSKATLKSERDAFKANAAADGVKLTERYSYDSLWNGVSVSVAPSQVATLRSVPA